MNKKITFIFEDKIDGYDTVYKKTFEFTAWKPLPAENLHDCLDKFIAHCNGEQCESDNAIHTAAPSENPESSAHTTPPAEKSEEGSKMRYTSDPSMASLCKALKEAMLPYQNRSDIDLDYELAEPHYLFEQILYKDQLEKDLGEVEFTNEHIFTDDTYSEKLGFRELKTEDGKSLAVVMCVMITDMGLPLVFCVYYDGKELRIYIPKDGNLYNHDTNMAFGVYGHEEDDAKYARKHKLNLEALAEEEDAAIDWSSIETDVINHIQIVDTKSDKPEKPVHNDGIFVINGKEHDINALSPEALTEALLSGMSSKKPAKKSSGKRKTTDPSMESLKKALLKKAKPYYEDDTIELEDILENDMYEALDMFYEGQLRKDLSKVEFDMENFFINPASWGHVGFQTIKTENGDLAVLMCVAGGDWEYPIAFCVYFDGKSLRAYIPSEGNFYNKKVKAAFGNDEDADDAYFKSIGTSFKEVFEDGKEHEDWNAIIADIANRIEIITE